MKAAALAICMLVQVVHAGKPGPSCSEIPVKWTMEYASDYNLYGDGNPYGGTLFVCGSGDVTMNLTRTSRYVNNAFSPLEATNSSSPAWAMNASTFTSQPFLNVRSILGYAVDQRGPNNSLPTQDYTLTTHFGGFLTGRMARSTTIAGRTRPDNSLTRRNTFFPGADRIRWPARLG